MSNAQLQVEMRRVRRAETLVEEPRQRVARRENGTLSPEAVAIAHETLIVLKHSLTLRRYNLKRLLRTVDAVYVN